jgi:hypothetical protein
VCPVVVVVSLSLVSGVSQAGEIYADIGTPGMSKQRRNNRRDTSTNLQSQHGT